MHADAKLEVQYLNGMERKVEEKKRVRSKVYFVLLKNAFGIDFASSFACSCFVEASFSAEKEHQLRRQRFEKKEAKGLRRK